MRNDALHAVLCIFTGGLWLPCWLLACCCDSADDHRVTIVQSNVNSTSCEYRPVPVISEDRDYKINKPTSSSSGSSTGNHAKGTMNDCATYHGHKVEGQRHGFGVTTYPAGDTRLRYEGTWVNDRQHGHGVLHYRKGGRYEGQFADNKRDGHGVHYAVSGVTTHGVWVSDKLHGRARCVLPNGCEAHGDFVAGSREGMWLLVAPPAYGNRTANTLWRDNKLVKFCDEPDLVLPVVTVSTALDTTNLWLDFMSKQQQHQQQHSFIHMPPFKEEPTGMVFE